MADPKKLDILLVEDCLEDDQFLREAMSEIIEAPNWPNWHSCELMPADCLHDALELLDRQSFDVILLNPSLPDGETLLSTFAEVQAASNSRPIIILADSEDENLAHTLLREGAQDVLVKAQVDCEVLARSLRYAIERQRRISALESISFFDDLTGLYNARGFAAMAEHDLERARQRGESLVIEVIELAGLPRDRDSLVREARELVLIRAGELLRVCFGESAVVARIGAERFGVCTTTCTAGAAECATLAFEQELETIKRLRRRAPVDVRMGSATYSGDYGGGLAELLQEAESRLAPKVAMLAH